MKAFFTKVFWPILSIFETGEAPPGYKPLHRKILLVVGLLFLVLACVSLYFGVSAGQWGALFPVVVFFGASMVCSVVALLGSDGAVARIWGVR